MWIRHLKNTLLIFPFSILFFSCKDNSNIKSGIIKKGEIQKVLTDSNRYSLADSLTFKALYDSSNKILLPEIKQFLNDSNYTAYVDAANRIAANYRKLGNYNSAFAFITKSLEISDKHLDSANLSTAQSYYLLGLMYKDFWENTETLNYLNKSLTIRRKLLSKDDPLVGDIYNNIGVAYEQENNYPKALSYFKNALRLRKTRGFFNKSVGSTYMNIGNLYFHLAEYELSVTYFDTAMTIEKKILGNNHPFIGAILLNKANSYDSIGELDSAIICDKKALKIFKNTFGETHPYIADTYNNLGFYYESFGDHKIAIDYYKKSIDIKNKLNAAFTEEYLVNYINLSISYRMLSNYKASINVLQKALKIIKSNEKVNVANLSKIKNKLALTYLGAGNNSLALKMEIEAISELEQSTESDSLQIFGTKIFLSHILNKVHKFDKSILNSKNCINYFKNKDLSWTVFGYELLAEAYLQKKEYLNVLKVYDNIKFLFADSGNTENMDLRKINSYSNVNGLIIETLHFIGKANLELFNKSKERIYLDNADGIYKFIMELFSSNYGNKVVEFSKIKETEKAKIFIQIGLKAAYKNFVLKPTKAHFEHALNLAEFGKSLTVLESLGKNSALKLSNIPTASIRRITALKKKIQYFLKQLSSEGDVNISDKEKKNLKDRLFKARFEYGELRDSLDNKYPIYKSLTQISLNNSLANIKTSILDNDQSAIEYYLGQDELYSFIISGSNFYILKKKLDDDFNTRINSLLEGIKNNQRDIFRSNAYYIYQTIFAEANSLITTKRVLIINDGILGYIPYDALLYEKPRKNESYKNLPYLIRKYSIGYAYSFNVLGKSVKGNNIISKFLGIAPFSK